MAVVRSYLTFAEYFTTLATGLTVLNVYSSASVSSPPAGLSGLSFRSQHRFGKRTITSSSRLYLTMALPYIAATVLVQEIATEEVTPIFIAAVASISGRFNKGRHTFVEWVFKSLRTFTTMATLAGFMLFYGLHGEIGPAPKAGVGNKLRSLYDLPVQPYHALLSWITSFRWFALLFIGFLSVPEKQKRSAVLLAALKICFVWLLIGGTQQWRTDDAWAAFDIVIVTSTPLRNTIYVLYSVLIALDAAESVTAALITERAEKEEIEEEVDDVVVAPTEYSLSDTEEGERRFPPVSSLRRRNVQTELIQFEEFWDEATNKLVHLIQMSFARLRKAPSDLEIETDLDIEAPPVVASTRLRKPNLAANSDSSPDSAQSDDIDIDCSGVVGINIRRNTNS